MSAALNNKIKCVCFKGDFLSIDKYCSRMLFFSVITNFNCVVQDHCAGIRVGEHAVRRPLGGVAPRAQQARATIARRLINPVPYSVDYFGEKLHVDQNEKLIRWSHACFSHR